MFYIRDLIIVTIYLHVNCYNIKKIGFGNFHF